MVGAVFFNCFSCGVFVEKDAQARKGIIRETGIYPDGVPGKNAGLPGSPSGRS